MQNHLLHTQRFLPGNYGRPGYTYELTPERIRFISQRLNEFVHTSRPFLQFGYAIRNLAEDIDVPSYQLSAYLNREIGLNFNDYLNQYRVKFCEGLIRNGMVGELNLKGLALRCGFSNRNTLTTAFKKFTGLTPSEYARSVQQVRSSN
ncbi:MAG: helix-turn-helix domain-containing protein [Chitinophagaceae bacterium]